MAEATASGARDRIRTEQVRILYSNVPVAVGAGGGSAMLLILALMESQLVSAAVGAFWIAATVACVTFHLGLWGLHRRATLTGAAWRPWLFVYVLACLAEGVSAGLGSIALTLPDDIERELLVLLVTVGMAASSITFYGVHMAPFAAFFVPALLPHMIFGLTYRYRLHEALGVIVAMFVIFVFVTAYRFHRQLVESLWLRFENLDLLDEVSRERERAEEANLAKSRFLASASHDLRQPLHAVSLFVGALRLRRLDRETRRLVDHVGTSVGAMDGLFGALLDISKLDAGATRVEHRIFALRPLMTRVCAELRLAAEAKGLRLRTRLADATLETDPFLLECVLRNLVSNAVRYTDRGGLLVAVRRPRVGRPLRIEVWDTGRGVAPDEQARIFQEFYQVAAGQTHRAQGLGLGLTIVRRMAALLEGAVDLSSRPGRGSVFRIVLPPPVDATPDAETPPPSSARPAAGLILVLDDEPAVREGMRSLLAGWGHEVIVAASGAEMLDRVAESASPSLIICDYGLGQDEAGPDVVRRLRDRFGQVPALLVTGDTRPERLAEARAAGLPLLHKPVSNSRLRAAIGNLVGAEARR